MKYTDEDNPFGDSQLSKAFVWHKKSSGSSSKRGKSPHATAGLRPGEGPDEKRARISKEATAAREARRRRDDERALVQEEREKEARRKQADENADWEFKEEQFLAKQFYAAVIRRVEGARQTLLDSLCRAWIAPSPARPVSVEELLGEAKDEVLLGEVVDGCERELDRAELVPVRKPPYVSDGDGKLRATWWTTIRDLAQAVVADRKAALHPMANQIAPLIEGKNSDELELLAREIQSAGSPDMEFWSAVLARIKRTRLTLDIRDMEKVLLSKVRQLEREIKDAGARETAVVVDEEGNDPDLRQGHVSEADWLANEKAKKMGEDEDQYNDEVDVEQAMQKYLWHDKYRPRKPKYFNRVHTAYDWNKYNQTHYDHDNPPPKTVQAYKFNLFYPDLIDKSKTPTYKIEKTDNPDVAILRFSAGPPYQDVAFKVINREWEHSHKRGYRCSFERGVLHLWFNFKRYRYRR